MICMYHAPTAAATGRSCLYSARCYPGTGNYDVTGSMKKGGPTLVHLRYHSVSRFVPNFRVVEKLQNLSKVLLRFGKTGI